MKHVTNCSCLPHCFAFSGMPCGSFILKAVQFIPSLRVGKIRANKTVRLFQFLLQHKWPRRIRWRVNCRIYPKRLLNEKSKLLRRHERSIISTYTLVWLNFVPIPSGFLSFRFLFGWHFTRQKISQLWGQISSSHPINTNFEKTKVNALSLSADYFNWNH